MSEVKMEYTSTSIPTPTTKNFKNKKIDISPILRDVEQCIQTGLDSKLQSLFYEFETYEQTHNEVLNLTVVKNLVNHNNMLTRIVTNSVCKKEVKCEEPHHNNAEDNSEINLLKQEILQLKEELSICQQMNNEKELSTINLEIKEKKCDCICSCNKNEDISIVNKMLLGQNVKNIILQENHIEECEAEEEEEVEEEEAEEEETEEEAQEEEEEEEEAQEEAQEEEAEEEAQEEEEEEAEEEEAQEEEAEEEEAEEEEAEEEEAEEEEEEEEEVKLPTFPTKSEIISSNTKDEVKKEDDVETEDEEEVEVEAEDEEEEQEEEQQEEEQEEEEVETEAEAEEEEVETEAEAEEEEEEELFEVTINGVMYVSNDDECGNIYSYINEEVGDKVGEFKDKNAIIYDGKNKGMYDRTKYDFNL